MKAVFQHLSLAQFLTILATVALAVAALLARRRLRADPRLRGVFIGLLFAAIFGMAISFSNSLMFARLFALAMLGGIAFLVWTLHVHRKRAGGGA